MKTVLIIEDDEDISDSLRILLEDEGYLVTRARDGQLALELLQKSALLPNLILLDLMMPVMDGFQFRLRQREDSRLAAIPVVVMTADGHVEAKKARIQSEAFIKKPFEIDVLLDAVSRYSA